MAKKIEDVLGTQKEDKQKNPATATPDGEQGEDNPLEKMDEISKAKPQQKDRGSKSLDDDIVTEMLKTGENTEGMFVPKDEEEHEDEDDKAKVKVGKDVKPSEKYKDQFKNDMLKHPDDYKLKTPRGEMTVAEAIKAGYNPMTKTFDESKSQNTIKDKYMSGLNDADKEAIEKISNPSAAQVAPADAEMYGLKPGSPMIKQEQPAVSAPVAPATPQQGGQTLLGTAMPGAQESVAPGGVDLSALLGGGQ